MAGRPDEARPSLISSFIGAVGRELQQFVLNAAGVNQVATSQPPTSTTSPLKRRVPIDEDIERPRKRTRVEHPRQINTSRVSSEASNEGIPGRYHGLQVPSPRNIPSKVDHGQRSGSTLREDHVQKRRTMPGAFSETEDIDIHYVRFASRTASTPPPSPELPLSSYKTTYAEVKTSFASQEPSFDGLSATPPPSTADSEEYSVSQRTESFVAEGQGQFTRKAPSFLSIGQRTPPPITAEDGHNMAAMSLRDAEHKAPHFTYVTDTLPQQMRIAELEEEVKRLKEELTLRSVQPLIVPPPPPPPPPPPSQTSQATKSTTSNVLVNARAALKGPSSITISAVSTSSSFKPTIPADQMAAFLDEMKSVRLRKVGSIPDIRGQETTRSSSRPLSRIYPLSQQIATNLMRSNSLSASGKRIGTAIDPIPSLCPDKGDTNEEGPLPTSPSSISIRPGAMARRHQTRRNGLTSEKKEIFRVDHAVTSITPIDQDDNGQPSHRHNASHLLPNLSPGRPRPPVRTITKTSTRQGSTMILKEGEADPMRLISEPTMPHSDPRNNQARRHILPNVVDEPLTTNNISSLEYELRRTIRAEVEKEFEDELRELGGSNGTRSRGHQRQRVGTPFTEENTETEGIAHSDKAGVAKPKVV